MVYSSNEILFSHKKKKKRLIPMISWMNLKNTMPSKGNRTYKTTGYVIPFTWRSVRGKNCNDRNKLELASGRTWVMGRYTTKRQEGNLGGDGIDPNFGYGNSLEREFTFDKTHQTVRRKNITFTLWKLHLKLTFYKREGKFAFFEHLVWLDTRVTVRWGLNLFLISWVTPESEFIDKNNLSKAIRDSIELWVLLVL